MPYLLDQWYDLLVEEIDELFLYRDSDKLVNPITYEKAISDIDASKWQISMESEMQSTYFNQIVDPSE